MKRNKKGQQAIVGMLFTFILIAAFAILVRPMLTFINIGVNATANATEGNLIGIIFNIMPLFIALMVMVASVIMITGRR